MLTEKQKKAVQMLYEGEKVQDTAAFLGVHRCTLWRWMQRSDFRKERRRIDRNWRRRQERYEEKQRIKKEQYWQEKISDAEAALKRESEKIVGKPSDSFYKAWDAYENALFRGLTWAQIFEVIMSDKPIKSKRRRR